MQHSHGLASLAASDLLIRLEPGSAREAGDSVTVFPLNFELTQVLKKD